MPNPDRFTPEEKKILIHLHEILKLLLNEIPNLENRQSMDMYANMGSEQKHAHIIKIQMRTDGNWVNIANNKLIIGEFNFVLDEVSPPFEKKGKMKWSSPNATERRLVPYNPSALTGPIIKLLPPPPQSGFRKMDDLPPAGHHTLSQGKPVIYAGSVKFSNGSVEKWGNDSGHYQPHFKHALNVPFPLNKFRSYHATEENIKHNQEEVICVICQLISKIEKIGGYKTLGFKYAVVSISFLYDAALSKSSKLIDNRKNSKRIDLDKFLGKIDLIIVKKFLKIAYNYASDSIKKKYAQDVGKSLLNILEQPLSKEEMFFKMDFEEKKFEGQ